MARQLTLIPGPHPPGASDAGAPCILSLEAPGRAIVERQVVRVEFLPGLGELTTRRLTGCLSDAMIPLAHAQVLAVSHSS